MGGEGGMVSESGNGGRVLSYLFKIDLRLLAFHWAVKFMFNLT